MKDIILGVQTALAGMTKNGTAGKVRPADLGRGRAMDSCVVQEDREPRQHAGNDGQGLQEHQRELVKGDKGGSVWRLTNWRQSFFIFHNY